MSRLIAIVTCLAFMANAALAAATISPLSPAQERATFQLADTNLTIELAAAEPEVRAPVAIAWDADGKMFVAEMTDYPSGPTSGRIRVLEDSDGDGRYERATIFATNLAFPNGVMAWKNGLFVTAAPDIWFLADTNNDGVADVREKILTGFAEGNQQLRVNGLFWGIDNWIYGANGRSDGEVRWADGAMAGSIRRHDFRFRPDTKQFEAIAGNSQFGMGHDDWGNRFPVFNNTPIRHVVMEERYIERQPLLAGTDIVPSISPTNDGNRVFALTPPTLLIPQAVGFFTSACGPSSFRGTALPESHRGNYFVCEPVQNVVQRRVVKPNGSTFIAEYADAAPAGSPLHEPGGAVFQPPSLGGWKAAAPVQGPEAPREFLASTDRWFHGVFTATGPDGAFYIVDFYRDLVEHPHWVAPELRDKIDWRKGEEHGRIWRVRARDAKLATRPKLSRASNAQLISALESENGWTRDTAQRLLVERNAIDAITALEQLASKGATPQSRVCALNLLAEFSPRNVSVLVEALADPHPRVRETAALLAETIMTGPQRSSAQQELRDRFFALCDDPDARVRLRVASTFAVPTATNGLIKVLACVARHRDLDSWQALAILSNVGGDPWPLLQELKPLLENGTDAQLSLMERLAALAAKDFSHATELIDWLQHSTTPNRLVLLASFADALSKERAAVLTVPLNQISEIATDKNSAERIRVAAIRLMAAIVRSPERQQNSVGTLSALASLLTREQSDSIQSAVAKALVESDNSALARAALTRWAKSSKAARQQIIASAIRTRNSALALLDAAESGEIARAEIDPTARQALQKHRDSVVAARAKAVFADVIDQDREAAVQRFRPALKLEGDRKRGAALFERTCAVCHQMQGVGAKVGPDLSAVGQHARETLLVDILDPSRQVLPDFMAYTAETKTGEGYTGFIANESATTVTLRRPNEPDVTLQRSQLNEFKTSGKSLMPDGLEVGMSEQDMADLIEFLRRPDRTLFTQTR